MNQSAEVKLHELRSKTDRQLASLISNKLDLGLGFARALEGSHGMWASMEHFLMNAEQAMTEATSWMTLLDNASPLERRRLEFKLNQLRTSLDRARTSHIRVQAAC